MHEEKFVYWKGGQALGQAAIIIPGRVQKHLDGEQLNSRIWEGFSNLNDFVIPAHLTLFRLEINPVLIHLKTLPKFYESCQY